MKGLPFAVSAWGSLLIRNIHFSRHSFLQVIFADLYCYFSPAKSEKEEVKKEVEESRRHRIRIRERGGRARLERG